MSIKYLYTHEYSCEYGFPPYREYEYFASIYSWYTLPGGKSNNNNNNDNNNNCDNNNNNNNNNNDDDNNDNDNDNDNRASQRPNLHPHNLLITADQGAGAHGWQPCAQLVIKTAFFDFIADKVVSTK